jgi:uncharacterized protein
MMTKCRWDERKATTNREKHGVTFDEACTVFDDPHAVIFDDPMHSNNEWREIIIGHSNYGRLLFVSFTERVDHVRIISARGATARERRDYEQGTKQ